MIKQEAKKERRTLRASRIQGQRGATNSRTLKSPWQDDLALGFVALFLCVLLLNSFEVQSSVCSLTYFPSMARESEPFVVTALVRNAAHEPRTYSINIFVDGLKVLESTSKLEGASLLSFTYTSGWPKLGSATRIYIEVLDVESGAVYSDSVLVPSSPPEVWMSFAAFSSFATSLLSSSSSSSSSAMSSTFTIVYYLNVMGLSSALGQSALPFFNVGLVMTLTLVLLLVFVEVTDPSYGKLAAWVTRLRRRYGLLATGLLLIFLGMVLTRVVMIIAG